MAYDLRERNVKNYKEITSVEQCKAGTTRRRPLREKRLYELEVIERDTLNRRVKVHYVGYDSDDDEWRDEKDIEIIYPVPGEPQ